MSLLAGELFAREIARRDFGAFCQYVKPDFILGRPQKILIDTMARIERGELKRVMISMPPRHGKSLIVTQMYPCWHLGRHPRTQIVQTTYAHPLSLAHSRLARKIFLSDEYNRIFPETKYQASRESQDKVSEIRQAADEWGTGDDGHYYAVGVGGGLTGRGADIAIIDDPIKNREEANSETVREKVWAWYQSTLYTRLSPDAALLLVMTRWHPDDPAGRIMERLAKGEDDEPWEIINLPAWDEAQEEALWPERWPTEKLKRIRNAIGEYEWNSLYMGQPVLRGGNILKVDRIITHNDTAQFPASGYVRAWDLASTGKERAKDNPDYTAGAKVALTIDGEGQEHLWVHDISAGQWEVTYRDSVIVQRAHDDGAGVAIGIEAVGGYKDSVKHLRKRIAAQGMSRTVKAISGKDLAGDKVARATPVEAIIEGGRMHMLRGDWNDLFIQQAREFPTGKHDDLIDSVALGYHEARRRRIATTKTGNARERLAI